METAIRAVESGGALVLPSQIQPERSPRCKPLSRENPTLIYRPCVPDEIAGIGDSIEMTISDGVLSSPWRDERVDRQTV